MSRDHSQAERAANAVRMGAALVGAINIARESRIDRKTYLDLAAKMWDAVELERAKHEAG